MNINKNNIKKLYPLFFIAFIVLLNMLGKNIWIFFIILIIIFLYKKINLKKFINKNMGETINLDDLKMKKNMKKIFF